MPRDGSGVYSRPPGTDAVADTTIDSAKYNNNVADVEADLNLPRPIVAGGTGASSAAQALTNLGVANMAVRYDAAQTLTVPQREQARGNIFAAPFDALAFNGMQINGSFEVTQEKAAGSGTTTSGSYICDGWQLSKVGAAVITASITTTPVSPGYPYSQLITVGTAQASMLAGDYVAINQQIEGWRVARLGWGAAGAQPITIGFWSAHHRTGIYSGAVRNGANNRSYAFTYTQNVADVAQFNTVTIPGDAAGTWATDQTAGMALNFAMACGATFTAPSANSWQAGNFTAAPGQINAVAATTDMFRIAGVVALPGSEAPNAARASLIMRPYPQELLTCQRYYNRMLPPNGSFVASGFCYSATLGLVALKYNPMRIIPTISVRAAADFVFTFSGGAPTLTNLVATAIGPDVIRFDCTTSGLAAGQGGTLQANTVNAQMYLDARF